MEKRLRKLRDLAAKVSETSESLHPLIALVVCVYALFVSIHAAAAAPARRHGELLYSRNRYLKMSTTLSLGFMLSDGTIETNLDRQLHRPIKLKQETNLSSFQVFTQTNRERKGDCFKQNQRERNFKLAAAAVLRGLGSVGLLGWLCR